jgi:hypothetical protein
MLFLSAGVREKLLQRNITEAHLLQCFANREHRYLEDNREEHRTSPPTMWFVSSTDYGIVLKICFVFVGDLIEIKTAYAPNAHVVEMYNRKAT